MKISRLLSWPRVVILLFWLVMTGWLIRYEAFPQWFDTSFYGYRSVFANGPLILDSWMRIEFRGTPIGYSHTWVDSQLDSPDETHTVKNTTFLNLNLMGRVSHINVNADAVLDSNYQLRHFSASLQSEAYVTQVTGDRTGPCRFATRLQTAAGHQDSSLTLPEDAMIYSPMTEMAICRLEPGQSLRF